MKATSEQSGIDRHFPAAAPYDHQPRDLRVQKRSGKGWQEPKRRTCEGNVKPA